MKILIVSPSESIHTARWIQQMTGNNWEIHLFSSTDNGVNNELLKSLNIKIHHTFYSRIITRITTGKKGSKRLQTAVSNPIFPQIYRGFVKKFFPNYQKKYLARVIKKIKPDIIHSMEIQQAGYLVNEVKKKFKGQFPKWVVTTWGSDVYLFGRLRAHKEKIKEVLENCDYYSCECQRDTCVASDYGLKSEAIPIGGFELKKIKTIRGKIKPSKRKIIMVKGYQGWAGRALVALRALARCEDLLKGYKIILYSVQPNTGVDIAAELLADKTKIPVEIMPLLSSHREMLKLYAQSRIYLGLSISDGISNSLLESMALGSFPIQSNTSCADEWVQDGKSGMIVPPEDPEMVEKAIRKALTDDKLVDKASIINWKTIKKQLDEKVLKKRIRDFYQRIINTNEA